MAFRNPWPPLRHVHASLRGAPPRVSAYPNTASPFVLAICWVFRFAVPRPGAGAGANREAEPRNPHLLEGRAFSLLRSRTGALKHAE